MYPAETAVAHYQNMIAGTRCGRDGGYQCIEIIQNRCFVSYGRQRTLRIPAQIARIAKNQIGILQAAG